jgi:hypothetical protein
VAHLHYRHAAAAPVEQLFPDAPKDGKGKRARARIEIENAAGGFSWKRGRSHDDGNLFVLESFNGSRAVPVAAGCAI